MQLIDKEQNSAFGLLDLIEDGFQPLLEFAPVFGTGNQCAHIQGKNGLVLQALGHVLLYDTLGQTLGNGSFTNAGLTNQHRVILGLPGENPNHIPDFLVTANHRVHLLLPGPLYQVGAVLLQGIIGALGVVGGHPLVAPDGLQGLHGGIRRDAVGAKQVLDAALGSVQQPQEQMLHGDVLILHVLCPVLGGDKGLVQCVADINLVGLPCAGDAGELGNLCHGGSGQAFHGDAHLGQQLGDQPTILLQQGGQQVNLLQLLMVVANRQILRFLNGFLRFLREVL